MNVDAGTMAPTEYVQRYMRVIAFIESDVVQAW